MAANSQNTVGILITAQSQASPVLKQTASEIDKISDSSIRSHPGIQALLGDFEKLKQQAAAAQEALGKTPSVTEQVSAGFGKISTSVLNIVQTGGPFIGFALAIVGYLRQIDAQMDQTLDSIKKMSTGIGTGLQATIKQVAVIQAQASGDRLRIIEATAEKEVASAEVTKNAIIEKAKEENAKVQSSWTATGAQRIAANAKMVTEIAAAEADLSNKTVIINEEKKAKLIALEKERTDAIKQILSSAVDIESHITQLTLESKGKQLSAIKEGLQEQERLLQEKYEKELEGIEKLFGASQKGEEAKAALQREYSDKAILLEQQTAEKRIQIIEQLTSKAVTIAKGLGEQFSQEFGRLSVAKFLQDTQEQIKALEGFKEAVKSGDKNLKDAGVTMSDVDGLINQLKSDMKDAATHGVIPLHDAVKDLTDATNKQVDAGEAWLQSLEGISPALDAIAAKARATKGAVDSLSGGSSGGGNFQSNPQSNNLGDFTVLGDITNQSKGSGLPAFDPANDLPHSISSFADGGVIPGPRGRPRLIVAHGGEPIGRPEQLVSAFVEASQRLRGPNPSDSGDSSTHLHFGPSSVVINGDIASQRDINTMVEVLAQKIDERNRRRR